MALTSLSALLEEDQGEESEPSTALSRPVIFSPEVPTPEVSKFLPVQVSVPILSQG